MSNRADARPIRRRVLLVVLAAAAGLAASVVCFQGRASAEPGATRHDSIPSLSAGEQTLLGRALGTTSIGVTASATRPSVSVAAATAAAAGVFGHDPVLGAEIRHVTSTGVLNGDYWIVALEMTGAITGHLPHIGVPAPAPRNVTLEPYRFVFVNAQTGAYAFAMDGSLLAPASRRLVVTGGQNVARGSRVTLRGVGFDRSGTCRSVRVQIDESKAANARVGPKGAFSVTFVIDRHLVLGSHQLSVWQPADPGCRLPLTATEITVAG
jgi:hypothetical protein